MRNLIFIELERISDGVNMNELEHVSDLLAGLPPGVLVLILILSAFGLTAYAIYAVLTVSKKER